MANSLVSCLGSDCSAAAALATAVDTRRGGVLDLGAFSGVPQGALHRSLADFEDRGWLVRQTSAWYVPQSAMPTAVPAFLAGMAAMRGPAMNQEAALTAVTLPPPPSAIAAALPATGVSYASLLTTEEAMARVAGAAASRLTILTPFLNSGGLEFAVHLFDLSKAPIRTLVIRGRGQTRVVLRSGRDRLASAGITILDCVLPRPDGYETFHAKVVLADDQLAYVGSANFLTHSNHSMELGNVVQGRAATVVASVVRAVEAASMPWRWAE
jgi:hypothetical protein